MILLLHRFPGQVCAGLVPQLLFTGLLLLLSACTSTGPYSIDLMPAPDVYDPEKINPFSDENPIENIPYPGILYATDRQPAEEDSRADYYENDRGHVLRLGMAQVALGENPITWEEARRISLLKNRTEKYPLKVAAVDKFGILEDSLNVFTRPYHEGEASPEPGHRFARFVNEKLRNSRIKDISPGKPRSNTSMSLAIVPGRA